MKVLPIGSVIQVENTKGLIVSHFKKAQNEKVVYYYLVVPYPKGFVGEEKMIAVPFDAKKEVLFEGYMSEHGQTYTKQLETISTLASKTDLKTMQLFERVMAEAVKTI